MTRPSTPPILSELRSPTSSAGQVAALRALKNEIIGHEQKKQHWVALGIVAPIVRILRGHKGVGKRRHREHHGEGNQLYSTAIRTDEEEARLQAINVVGSLACGGPAFLAPLSAGPIFPALFAFLSPRETSPPLVLATLRTVNTIADASILEFSAPETVSTAYIRHLYGDECLSNLVNILGQCSDTTIKQQQIALVATLINKTCREEYQRKALACSGIIEALSSNFLSLLTVDLSSNFSVTSSVYTTSALSSAPARFRIGLASILQAIATIVSNSRLRVSQFLCAPASKNLLRGYESPAFNWIQRWSPIESKISDRRQRPTDSNNVGLPDLRPIHHQDPNSASRLPLLGGYGSSEQPPHARVAFGSAPDVGPTEASSFVEHDDSNIFALLIHICRAGDCASRLMAAKLVTILYRSRPSEKRKETILALLVVPQLVRMLDKDFQIFQGSASESGILGSPEYFFKEQAPRVLEMLFVDSVDLQRAAVDAGAIKKLSQLLKRSYDPMPIKSNHPLWTSQRLDQRLHDVGDDATFARLGSPGLTPTAYRVMQTREAVLNALAALATFKDEYRRAIIDNGVVSFVIESLKPENGTVSSINAVANTSVSSGNPTSVLLAACHVARALSKSVSTLRTSLIDAGLAIPILALLKHHDLEVQVAATTVVCNLILEFSPMREPIVEAGVLKILCEHAHSMNARLRLNAVWALKHLMHTASNHLKMNCLEELGPGWLKQIICNDNEDLDFSAMIQNDKDMVGEAPIAMGTPNAVGEQVDLLNAIESSSPDSSHGPIEDEADEVNMIDSIGTFGREDDERVQARSASHARPCMSPTEANRQRFAVLHDDSDQSRRDDIAVQEQGLNFIRNLICGPGASEMIDYIFRELGQDKIFDMLATKLRPKVANAFNREKKSAENGVRLITPPTEIVISVLYIVIHVAAGLPRHRQLLISQSELFKLLLPLFGHSHREIRGGLVSLVTNLTWVDDHSDKMQCKARAQELRKLGMYEKLGILESDSELDIRERARTVVHQMKELFR